MCGVFGVSYGPGGAGAEEWTPTELAQLMFPAIVHRGPHAFGWVSYNPASGFDVVKHTGKVTDKKNAGKIVLDDDCEWFVGHVRWATNGSPDYLPNNHPIVHGGVVGVHNGVLTGWEDILKVTGREDDTAEVDSEAIFAAVNKWGVKDGLKRINGNMVAIFAETAHPNVMHIARTYGRPLVYCTTPTGALIFASECCVIDATQIQHDKYVTMTGRYRHLTVTRGVITSRSQYRADDRPSTTTARSTTRSVETGGVRGITDYFDNLSTRRRRGTRQTTPRDVAERTAGARTSLDEPETWPQGQGTANGAQDSDGGTYIGAGWYRLPDGKCLPVAAYVEWAVTNRMAKMEHEAAIEAAAEFESISRSIERGEVIE